MHRHLARILVFTSLSLAAACVWAAPQESSTAAPKSATPSGKLLLFGALPVSTQSEEALKLTEVAFDQYENVLLDMAVSTAHKATQKDPNFALAYALWSFSARRTQPEPEALRKAQALAAKATPEEQLLIRWLTSVQKEDLLPAIASMNDLLAKYPNDKHVLYLTSEWLYFQQDYKRARRMMEQILKTDPKFAPAYNMLGYAYVETGDPDPAKALSYLHKYAELEPNQPNPQDSLGEVSRYAGDDEGSLKHYALALKIIPNFITSQTGRGDTYALMGDYTKARVEYEKSLPMATNSRDRLHAEYQKTLVNFWEGKPAEGRKQLAALLTRARQEKDPYAQYEIAYGNALLAETAPEKIQLLRVLETTFSKPQAGMGEGDRQDYLAAVLREEARTLASTNQIEAAQQIVAKLEALATRSRDLIIEGYFESAQGFVLLAQGNLAAAAEQLASDPSTPLNVDELARIQEKLGNTQAAESTRKRLKYLRAPTADWILVSRSNETAAR